MGGNNSDDETIGAIEETGFENVHFYKGEQGAEKEFEEGIFFAFGQAFFSGQGAVAVYRIYVLGNGGDGIMVAKATEQNGFFPGGVFEPFMHIFSCPFSIPAVKEAGLDVREPAAMLYPLPAVVGQAVQRIKKRGAILFCPEDALLQFGRKFFIGIEGNDVVVGGLAVCPVLGLGIAFPFSLKKFYAQAFADFLRFIGRKRVNYHNFIGYGQQRTDAPANKTLLIFCYDDGRY